MSERKIKSIDELTRMDEYMFGTVREHSKLVKPLIEYNLDIRIVQIQLAEE